MSKFISISDDFSVRADEIISVGTRGSGERSVIWWRLKGTDGRKYRAFNTTEERDRVYDIICKELANNQQRTKTMSEITRDIKDYFQKNKDTIFTLAIVILVDHYVFQGQLRETIKQTIESILKKLRGE